MACFRSRLSNTSFLVVDPDPGKFILTVPFGGGQLRPTQAKKTESVRMRLILV